MESVFLLHESEFVNLGNPSSEDFAKPDKISKFDPGVKLEGIEESKKDSKSKSIGSWFSDFLKWWDSVWFVEEELPQLFQTRWTGSKVFWSSEIATNAEYDFYSYLQNK